MNKIFNSLIVLVLITASSPNMAASVIDYSSFEYSEKKDQLKGDLKLYFNLSVIVSLLQYSLRTDNYNYLPEEWKNDSYNKQFKRLGECRGQLKKVRRIIDEKYSYKEVTKTIVLATTRREEIVKDVQ